MIRAGSLSVDANAEANRTSAWPQDQMQIPRVKAEKDAAARRAEHRRFAVNGPFPTDEFGSCVKSVRFPSE